ncbi:M50 family metallopeptidase [Pseudosulfitobacter pseudonitzschiae]|uniref:M50 family metallopeptidase n=1 Tax=Pseudosulfitobacter pseudonitzschiae TaxID=1402135 RepID=UPI003B7AFABC
MFVSRRLATILGTDLNIHPSVLILLAVVIGPSIGEGQQEITKSIIFAGLILASITLHEFGHILMARRLGHETGDINLNAMGGLATIKSNTMPPKDEFLVSIAGPAVNLIIASAIFLLFLIVDAADDTLMEFVIMTAIATNVVLLVFNMLPVFPMDGGRVLRSLMAIPFGLYAGTLIALSVGVVILVPMTIYAVTSLNFILIFICLFLLTYSVFEFFRIRQDKHSGKKIQA